VPRVFLGLLSVAQTEEGSFFCISGPVSPPVPKAILHFLMICHVYICSIMDG
jgi:hypothetical protein